jgi:hypothetical protein
MASIPVRATVASPSPARLVLTPGANLLGLLAAIDDAPGARVLLDATDLPRALQTRTILTVLRRRADRRGKRLHLLTPSQTLWRLARLAELDGVAASEVAAVSLVESWAARMPADAVPAVVIDASEDLASGGATLVGPTVGQEEPDTKRLRKVLGILARNELNLEPIPALGTDPTNEREGRSYREPDEVPVPKLATLVAWLDADTRAPVTGGSHRGGPEEPDDGSWLPVGAARGERLPAPASTGQGPHLRVVRSGHKRRSPRTGGGFALHGVTAVEHADNPVGEMVPTLSGQGSVDASEGVAPPPPVRRPVGRLLRSDVARDRNRDRVSRRSLNRDRLDRLAGRGQVGAPTARTCGEFTATRKTAPPTDQGERVRRHFGDAAQPASPLRRPTVALMAIAAGRASVRTLSWATGVTWRRLSGIRLSGAAMARLGAVAITAVAIGAFTWYVVPSATVEIVPVLETWSTTVPAVVDPSTRKADPATGRVPGRWIVKEVTDTRQANATGKRVLPDGKAGGDAVFTNRSERQISVPKGTIVAGAGVRFATQLDIVVPPTLTVGPQKRFGVGRAQVIAEVGGTAGNLDRGKIATIEGPLSSQLDVQNDQPLRGGTERTVVFVSADDRRKLLETAQKGAIESLATQVKSLTIDPTKEVAVPLGVVGTLVTIPGVQGPGVVEASFSKSENDEAASVSVTVKARYAVTVFESAVAQQVALVGATTMVAQQRPGFAPTGAVARTGTPEIGSVDPASGQVQVRVRVDTTVAPIVSVADVRAAIAGRPIDEARETLTRMSGIASYRLASWPGWSWKQTLPALGWRIRLTTATAASSL